MTYSTPSRPQPPSISDPRANENDDYAMVVNDEGELEDGLDDEDGRGVNWMKRALDAFNFSTTYIDSNYRKQWEDSIRSFHSQHPGESKYNSEQFRKRSTMFRPKTRSIIRKNEAAAAAAFFSNVDRVSVTPMNDGDQKQRLSADLMKELLNYRLTKSIPWFQTVIGGLQDAQVQGPCCAHAHWRYTTRKNNKGDLEKVEDKPVVDLIPIENIRIDPASHWLDPVNTSPYLIHLIPMFVCDVKERMRRPDPKGRKWHMYDDSVFRSYIGDSDDSTRTARANTTQEPSRQRKPISDYDVVWVHRHIHRYGGQDWQFYTLASEKMLTDPEPLVDTVFHGQRPYVIGVSVLETHRPYPSSVATIVKPLQDEANEVVNQRLDNVKFVLNKRWFAKRGKNVDLASLVRNVPAGITLMDDPENDVKEITWPDVTQSSYLEQDRIDNDFSDLSGNFDPMQVGAMMPGQPSTNTMKMIQGPANLLTEYMLKTYVETFVQPILRHLVLLEQHYETDATVLGIAGEKSKAFQKFGIDEVTDDLLDNELTITVNVGMGATDPVMKLQRFVYACNAMQALSQHPTPGMSLQEVAKEVFGLSGYQDGKRFFGDQDPDKVNAQKTIAMLMQKVKELTLKNKEKELTAPTKLAIAKQNNQTKVIIEQMKHEKDSKHLLASYMMDIDKAQQMQAMQPAEETK